MSDIKQTRRPRLWAILAVAAGIIIIVAVNMDELPQLIAGEPDFRRSRRPRPWPLYWSASTAWSDAVFRTADEQAACRDELGYAGHAAPDPQRCRGRARRALEAA